METVNSYSITLIICTASMVFYVLYRFAKYAFILNTLIIVGIMLCIYHVDEFILGLLYVCCPLLLVNTALYVFLHKTDEPHSTDDKYQVSFRTSKGNFKIDNIKRGASIIGSAGSGKTESVVYGFLRHFEKHNFCGVIHDYKDFEITEMAYPLFKDSDIPFKVISFDKIVHRVNPIAPQYLENEESVNEVSRVLDRKPIGTARIRHDRNDQIFQRCGRRIDWWIDLEIENFLSPVLHLAAPNRCLSILGY